MLILAFDTTAAACSVALWRDGQVLHQARTVMEQGQAEALMPMIEAVMGEAAISYAALDRIAVTVGPGSFTGVRVGLAAARGLGLASGKPVVGIATTDVLAAAVPKAERSSGARVVTAIDTKRGDAYVQVFDATGKPVGDIAVRSVEDLRAELGKNAAVVIGDAAASVAAILGGAVSKADPLPDAGVLARLASTRTPAPPLPLYVQPPAVTIAR